MKKDYLMESFDDFTKMKNKQKIYEAKYGKSSLTEEGRNELKARKYIFEKLKKGEEIDVQKELKEKFNINSESKLNEMQTWVNEAKKSKINEGDVTSKESFKDYVYTIYKEAFGDEFDSKKADDVIDGLIKKHGEDWGAMVGAVKNTMG